MTQHQAIPASSAVVRDRLVSAVAAGRLPHALLLHGPPGVGKQAVALDLAQTLLCPAAGPAACGTCNTCRRAAAHLHPDLAILGPDGQFIKVDPVRTMVRDSYLRPFEGRAKVFVFTAADRFNDESANTLLKTLEEPTPQTYLLLVTNRRQAVLATIRSRCQEVELRPLSRAEVGRALTEIHGLDPGEAETRARRASGSVAVALALDLAELAAQRQRLTRLLATLAGAALSRRAAAEVIELAATIARSGLEPFLSDVLRPVARDAMLLAAGAGGHLTIDPADDAARDLACVLGPADAAALLADIDQAEQDLRLNANKKLLIESLLLGVHQRGRRATVR